MIFLEVVNYFFLCLIVLSILFISIVLITDKIIWWGIYDKKGVNNMKYIVEFSVPIFCSCVIEAQEELEAWNKVSEYNLKQLKQMGYNPQIEDDNFETKDCDVVNVKPFQEI